MTTTKGERIANFILRIQRREKGDLEANISDREQLIEQLAEGPVEAKAALEGLENVRRGQQVGQAQAEALEAIIHKEDRPAIDIRDDTFTDVPFYWRELLTEAQSMLRTWIPGIGRVQSDRPYARYDGTAFVVGPDQLMTNRHVAEKFIRDVGAGPLLFSPFHKARVDLKVERGRSDERVLTILGARMVHPYWDMAILEVAGLDPDIKPLPLRERPLAGDELVDRPVAVIGYPYFDDRNPDVTLQNRIFQGEYGVKRLLPGYTGAAKRLLSYGNKVNVLTHDASTLGGNSGSAVIDLKTGEVLGLHFAGDYMVDNYAVPAWDIAADIRVRQVVVAIKRVTPPSEDPELAATWSSLPAPESTTGPAITGAPAVVNGPAPAWLPPGFLDSMDEAALAEALESAPQATRARLVEVLGKDEADDLIADLRDAGQEAPKAADPNLPEIIWVHGIMGGHLTRSGLQRRHLWLNGLSLVLSPLGELLALADDGVTDRAPGGAIGPDGYLGMIYAKAARKWQRAGFVVHEFSYDWRKSIAHAADRLHHFIETLRLDRPGRRFALVAHSMGGLVCSLYASRHPRWSDAVQSAVFMGSPMRGSFAPIEAMTGTYPFLRKLAFVAARASLDDLISMARTMPGLVDMLPDPTVFEVEPAYRSGRWSGKRPQQRWLDQSRVLKSTLIASPILACTTCLVSLHHPTVGALRNPDGEVGTGFATAAGDGTVPGRSSVLPGIPAFRVEYQHHAIPRDPKAIAAVIDLLSEGTVELEVATEDAAAETIAAPESLVDLPEEALEEIVARMRGEITLADLDWLLSRSMTVEDA